MAWASARSTSLGMMHKLLGFRGGSRQLCTTVRSDKALHGMLPGRRRQKCRDLHLAALLRRRHVRVGRPDDGERITAFLDLRFGLVNWLDAKNRAGLCTHPFQVPQLVGGTALISDLLRGFDHGEREKVRLDWSGGIKMRSFVFV
jgi:hypothetical protein